MLIINRLTKAGGIKSVVLRVNEVVVTTREGDKIVYEKKENRQ